MKQIDHKWAFRSRFRRHAFGWRSQTPIRRIKEAVSEIKRVARKDAVVAAAYGVVDAPELVATAEDTSK